MKWTFQRGPDLSPSPLATSMAMASSTWPSPTPGTARFRCCLTTLPAATTPSFGSAQDFTVGAQPSFLACADINGDGLLDLIVANNNAAGTISVLLNTTAVGAATASFAAHADFTVGDNPTGLAVGDLNGDGKPDVAVANNGSSSVSVLLNSTAPGSATPSFVGHVDFKTGASPYAVAVADLNGDGRADLVVTNGGAAQRLGARQHHRFGRHDCVVCRQARFHHGHEPDRPCDRRLEWRRCA